MRPIERLREWEESNNMSLEARLMKNTSSNPGPVVTFFDIARRWGIFAALFIGLLVYVLTGSKEERTQLMQYIDKQTEINTFLVNKQMEISEKQTEVNTRVATTLEKIDIRLQKLECK